MIAAAAGGHEQDGIATMLDVEDVMRLAPVIPVLVIDRIEDAVPIATALVAGGLPALEVTLRTPVALDAIRLMATVEGATVGAGTVLDARSLDAAVAAGARFIVSPGLSEPVARAAADASVPLLPGVATASDIMRGLDLGLSRFKFFPAQAAGGIPALSALAAPFGQVRFCPTGGISQANAVAWLDLEAVLCVGGSWMVRRNGVDPTSIEAAARSASTIRRRWERPTLPLPRQMRCSAVDTQTSAIGDHQAAHGGCDPHRGAADTYDQQMSRSERQAPRGSASRTA